MDVLTDVLRTVRLQSQCHARLELSAPWGIEVNAGGRPSSQFYVHHDAHRQRLTPRCLSVSK